MFNIHRVQLDWGGRQLTLETGRFARQADGAVFASYGDTTVLATVVAAKTPKEGIDFLPLTCNYQEKYYAAGRIPGGYFKREARPTEKETLVSRLIDRPIRPLFADGWRCDTQVIVNVLSHDLENDPDILGMVAASAALTLSGAPFMGPIGAARVGFINNEYVLNPQIDEMAGEPARSRRRRHPGCGADGGIGGQGALRGHHARRRDVRPPAFPAGDRRHHPAGGEGREGAARIDSADNAALEKEMLDLVEKELRAAYAIPDKMQRHKAVDAAKDRVIAHPSPPDVENPKYPKPQVAGVFKELEAKIVRWNILDTGTSHRRPRREDRTPDRLRSRRAAAHPRLGAVHPR